MDAAILLQAQNDWRDDCTCDQHIISGLECDEATDPGEMLFTYALPPWSKAAAPLQNVPGVANEEQKLA